MHLDKTWPPFVVPPPVTSEQVKATIHATEVL